MDDEGMSCSCRLATSCRRAASSLEVVASRRRVCSSSRVRVALNASASASRVRSALSVSGACEEVEEDGTLVDPADERVTSRSSTDDDEGGELEDVWMSSSFVYVVSSCGGEDGCEWVPTGETLAVSTGDERVGELGLEVVDVDGRSCLACSPAGIGPATCTRWSAATVYKPMLISSLVPLIGLAQASSGRSSTEEGERGRSVHAVGELSSSGRSVVRPTQAVGSIGYRLAGDAKAATKGRMTSRVQGGSERGGLGPGVVVRGNSARDVDARARY